MPFMILWTIVGLSGMIIFGVDDLLTAIWLFIISFIVALITRLMMTGYHEAINRRIAATTGRPQSGNSCQKAANLVYDIILWGGLFTGGFITLLGAVYAVWCGVGIIRCNRAIADLHRERMEDIRSLGQQFQPVHEIPAPEVPVQLEPIGSFTY